MQVTHNYIDQRMYLNALARVEEIDFSNIRWKLSCADNSSNWSETKIIEGEAMYTGYLALLLTYEDISNSLAPPELADDFWHAHILDTRKYMSDCNQLFGEYLHHFPYFGMRGDEDAANLVRSANLVFELLRYHFFSIQRYSFLTEKYSKHSDCSNCGKACSSCKSCGPTILSRSKSQSPIAA